MASIGDERTSAPEGQAFSEEEMVQEREHFKTVVNAFLYYKFVE